MATPENVQTYFGIIALTQNQYDELKKDSEQLRILKRFIENEEVLTKKEILTLLKTMEATNE